MSHNLEDTEVLRYLKVSEQFLTLKHFFCNVFQQKFTLIQLKYFWPDGTF